MFPLLAALFIAAVPDTQVVPLEEIVVTGTRVPQTALRVPAGVTVVDKRAFMDSRGNSIKDGLVQVPGVFVQSRGGGQDVRITIRGFGARGSGERSNSGSLRGIRIITDGIPVTEPDGRTPLDLVDLGSADRVEVSRSNASTLYGNASGGVVHLRTDLGFERPWVELRQRGGSFGYHREQLLTGFVMGAARGQLSLSNSTFGGWREHSESDVTLGQLRLSTPLDDRSVLRVALDGASDVNRFPGALTGPEVAEDPAQADSNWVKRDERRRNRLGRIGLAFDRELGGAQNLSLTAFAEPKVLQRSERSRFRDFNRIHTGGSAQWSGNFDLPDGTGLRVSAGADDAFQDGSTLFYNVTPSGGRSTTLRANKREAANSAGVFAQGDLSWSEHWRASVAARWDAVWYIANDYQDPALDAEKTFKRLTPKAALAWQDARRTVYAALGGGVEAPAFNEIDPPPPLDVITALNPLLEPMISTSWELGSKGVALERGPVGRLDYDVALYWIEVKNDLVPFNGGAYFETAGKTRRRGAELGLRWKPLSWLEGRASASWSKNEYVEYRPDTSTVNPVDFAGHTIAGLPRAMFDGSVTATHASGASLAVELRSVDGVFADDANTFGTRAYSVLGATAALERRAGATSWRVFVRGDNLTDADYIESVFINPVPAANPSDVRWLEPGLPANWSAGLSVRFGN